MTASPATPVARAVLWGGGGTSVTMPALGESVTEGTVTRWLKQEGDQVAADEPLLEVSTDKVDTEIPSPAAGVLQRIVVGEDETVAVGAELAVIGDGQADGGGQQSQQEEQQPAQQQQQQPGQQEQEPAAQEAGAGIPASTAVPAGTAAPSRPSRHLPRKPSRHLPRKPSRSRHLPRKPSRSSSPLPSRRLPRRPRGTRHPPSSPKVTARAAPTSPPSSASLPASTGWISRR